MQQAIGNKQLATSNEEGRMGKRKNLFFQNSHLAIADKTTAAPTKMDGCLIVASGEALYQRCFYWCSGGG